MEAGFPIASTGDFEAVQAVSQALPVKVAALARCTTLDIERVDSDFVSEWAKLEPLPVKGVLRGSVRAEGTRHDPGVMAELDADLLVLGAALKPKALLRYEKGDGRLELRVDDERGRWLDLAAMLDFADAPSLEALKERLPRVASDAAWSFTLVAGERTVTDLPGLRDAKVPAIAAASVVLEHAPGTLFQEPSGDAVDHFHRYPGDSVKGLAILALGLPVYWLWARRRSG